MSSINIKSPLPLRERVRSASSATRRRGGVRGPFMLAAFVFFLLPPITASDISTPTLKASPHSFQKFVALSERPSLWDTGKMLLGKKFVDLTHVFLPGVPHWKGFPDEQVKTIYSYAKDGFWA